MTKIVREETWAGAGRGIAPQFPFKQEISHVPSPPFQPPAP